MTQDVGASPARDFFGKLAAYLTAGLFLVGICAAVFYYLLWKSGVPKDLTEAAGVARVTQPRYSGILVLTHHDGSSGCRYREQALAAEGFDLSEPNLNALERYLPLSHDAALSSQAIRLLSQGWNLNWKPSRVLEVTAGRKEKMNVDDFMEFLLAIRLAPITPENYRKLEAMDEAAQGMKIRRASQAKRFYELFSAAYAHFGNKRRSLAWLQKIQGLFPLYSRYSDDVQVEPVAQILTGSVSGALFMNGHPPSDIEVGLFVVRSTSSALGGDTGLVEAVYPDSSGRFVFSHLTDGDYYLALRAATAVLGRDLQCAREPGVFSLTRDHPKLQMWPIEIASPELNIPQQKLRSRFGNVTTTGF